MSVGPGEEMVGGSIRFAVLMEMQIQGCIGRKLNLYLFVQKRVENDYGKMEGIRENSQRRVLLSL